MALQVLFVLLLGSVAEGLYLPGLAPTSFCKKVPQDGTCIVSDVATHNNSLLYDDSEITRAKCISM